MDTWTIPAPTSLASLVYIRLADGTYSSRQDIAEAAGISQASLSRYCSGHAVPRPATADRLAAALGVQPELVLKIIHHQ